jgi:hypothetical protein
MAGQVEVEEHLGEPHGTDLLVGRQSYPEEPLL